jgi:hypothetical protein
MRPLETICQDPPVIRNFVLLNEELRTVRKLVRVFVDATAGAVTKYLPDGLLADFDYLFAKTDSSGNAVTITPYGTQTIEGAGTFSLPNQYDKLLVTFYNGVWYELAV